ncbi:uncharacterized protein BYT42DRAFT_647741 [Radiomyces spectabilis]|uniref:uncharacterized protein n=1 Tax=Radiomyces spectabilis TaxID=64574 RepID=UPI00221EF012|nr:uncharacterized protein BYT42DRAFT_647741 [Radiomyces spectabilis]KAI8370494.1 hypothetical protein BYT42DRAFT_647741 [Radiomyces spectabilis]
MHMEAFVALHKTLNMACGATIRNVEQLKQDHKQPVRSGIKKPALSTLVQPTIVRLNEGKHASIIAEHGLESNPSRPNA